MTPKEVQDNIHDYWWRLNNLYYIKDKRGQKVLFVPNAAQCDFKKHMTHLNIILKARQLGFSTFIDIMGFDLAFWTENKEVVIQAQDREAAEKLFEEKIQFPYDNLPESVKAFNPRVKSNTRQMKFENGSTVRVVVSARSGTVNFLHISEFGKICAKFPDKARETVTGSLNTVASGQFIFIESTAEGREGAFYDMTQASIKQKLQGKKLTPNDYSFHFYPWYKEPTYIADPESVIISDKEHNYFNKIESEEYILISPEQRAWYCIKKVTQGEDMKREFPSTPKEAFEQSIKGAYFADDMSKARGEGRLTKIKYDPRLPVYTFWDIGRDTTSIWFMQFNRVDNEYRFINYMSDINRSLQYYVKEMAKLGYVLDSHYLPHDAEVTSLDNPDEISRADVLRGLGLTIHVVPRVKKKLNAIQASRDILPSCWFDEEQCKEGIKGLDHYRCEWDDKLGAFKREIPFHDWASHPADSFQQFAMGFKPPIRYNKSDLIPEETEDY